MTSRLSLLALVGVAGGFGCGGDAFKSGSGSTATAAATSGSGGATATSSAITSAVSSTTSAQTVGAGGASGAGGNQGSGGAAACPAVRGGYSVAAMGQGCADLDTTATQCIKQPEGSCQIEFDSQAVKSGKPAVNGKADLTMAGTFSGADITFGTQMRTGCTGLWNAATQQMDVNCGGVSSPLQTCTASLTRNGACP